MPSSKIAIPPDPEHVRVVRMVAVAAARVGGVPEDLLEEVRLAVGEAVARVVLRHRRSHVSDDVVVRFRDEPESFEVEIADAAPADLPEIDKGLSLALMSAMVPRSSLTPSPPGQSILLAWPLED